MYARSPFLGIAFSYRYIEMTSDGRNDVQDICLVSTGYPVDARAEKERFDSVTG